eukprot:6217524-Alexandrium_andersonii.AAC.1
MLFAAEEFVAATASPAVMVASCGHPAGLAGSAFGFVRAWLHLAFAGSRFGVLTVAFSPSGLLSVKVVLSCLRGSLPVWFGSTGHCRCALGFQPA